MIIFFSQYALFLIKAITLVVAILVVVAGVLAIVTKNRPKMREKILIVKLNEKYKSMREALNFETLSKTEFKKIQKKERKEEKANEKNEDTKARRRIFVLEFDGDLKASSVNNLREEITSILTVATPKDEVLIKIESPGGMVPGYGLAASQLKRIRDRNIPLIVAVDKVAASGGYMMACVADRIIAAPFAVIGSIGVVAQLPNFHKLLKKHNIDFEQITAGQYKRTLTLFGENTDEGRRKVKEEVEELHQLFKNFVALNRPIVDIEALATGETWYGSRARELRLVDELITSDDYLLNASVKANLFKVTYVIKKNLAEKITGTTQSVLAKLFTTA
jgi:serine protease SohB